MDFKKVELDPADWSIAGRAETTKELYHVYLSVLEPLPAVVKQSSINVGLSNVRCESGGCMIVITYFLLYAAVPFNLFLS